jgi:hypothetical protein
VTTAKGSGLDQSGLDRRCQSQCAINCHSAEQQSDRKNLDGAPDLAWRMA